MEGSVSAFANLLELAGERVGGKALWASDEFFAGKENLLKAGRGEFRPHTFDNQGQIYDGWESRRKGGREGVDRCIVRLGIAGKILGLDIDTNHFLGNYPHYASVDALVSDSDDPAVLNAAKWEEILPKAPLKAGSHNVFSVLADASRSWTHVRLNIYPDGGVARFRVYGQPVVDFSRFKEKDVVDLAAVEHGGVIECCNDMFYSNPANMLLSGRGINMGDGWETKRRREPGNDWAIIRLGHAGLVSEIEVDTCHFKGNHPQFAWVDALNSPDVNPDYLTWPDFEWVRILDEKPLSAHNIHIFKDILDQGPWTHIRLNINNGGVSRFRVRGQLCHGRAEAAAASGVSRSRA